MCIRDRRSACEPPRTGITQSLALGLRNITTAPRPLRSMHAVRSRCRRHTDASCGRPAPIQIQIQIESLHTRLDEIGEMTSAGAIPAGPFLSTCTMRAPRDAGGFSFALSTRQALDQGRRAPIAHKAHGAPAALLSPPAGSEDPFPPPSYLEQRRAHEAAWRRPQVEPTTRDPTPPCLSLIHI